MGQLSLYSIRDINTKLGEMLHSFHDCTQIPLL